ncbi:MAG: DUF3047 domain-containing protein [Burkholderiaceae bacterium]
MSGATANLLSDPAGTAPEPAAPWRVVGLPKQTLPLTRYRVIDADGGRAIEIDAQASYGNLVHEWPAPISARRLSWRWRIEHDNPLADIQHKPGDDHAVAVCALFDMPLAAIPLWERQMLRLARALSGEALPSATLCYTWDPRQRADTALASPYTRRVRWLVLRGQGDALHAWQREQRDLRADFERLFGDETRSLPPLTAVLVAADADNTQGRSLAWVADLALE